MRPSASQQRTHSTQNTSDEFAPLRRTQTASNPKGRQRSRKKKKKSESNNFLLIGGIAIGLLLLVGGGIAISVTMMRGIDEEAAVAKSEMGTQAASDSGAGSTESSKKMEVTEGQDSLSQTKVNEGAEGSYVEGGWNVEIEKPEMDFSSDQFSSEEIEIPGRITRIHICDTESPFIFVETLQNDSKEKVLGRVDLRNNEYLQLKSNISGQVEQLQFLPDGSRLALVTREFTVINATGESAVPETSSRRRESKQRSNINRKKPQVEFESQVSPLWILDGETGDIISEFPVNSEKKLANLFDLQNKDTLIIYNDLKGIKYDVSKTMARLKPNSQALNSDAYEVQFKGPNDTVLKRQLSNSSGMEINGLSTISTELVWSKNMPQGLGNFLDHFGGGTRLTPDRRYLLIDGMMDRSLNFFDITQKKITGKIIPGKDLELHFLGVLGWAIDTSRDSIHVLIREGNDVAQFVILTYLLSDGNFHRISKFKDLDLLIIGRENQNVHSLAKPGLVAISGKHLIDTETNRMPVIFYINRHTRGSGGKHWLQGNNLFLFKNIGSADGLKKRFMKIPLVSTAAARSIDAFRNNEPALFTPDTPLGVELHIESPYPTMSLEQRNELSELMVKAILKNDLQYDESSSTKICLYFGSDMTKRVYEENKSKITRSVDELDFLKDRKVDSRTNVILALVSEEKGLLWGEAFCLGENLFGLEGPYLPLDRQGMRANQTKIEVGQLFNKIRIPFFVPADSDLATLPIKMFYSSRNPDASVGIE
ncbi:hypothetical protein Pla110_35260 [Polystyrenella longa]|uniref:Uncharacterized protein n=1 Tax=Polystyrenella longa TaxID=2528007 RepID=A0A518CRB8_9PLAN|nr:hypothetical protein [Polystyrenella longa]QDU81776.1 hypothetical protein Pla110_35260 [Polystyrenella longa]